MHTFRFFVWCEHAPWMLNHPSYLVTAFETLREVERREYPGTWREALDMAYEYAERGGYTFAEA